MWDVIVLISEHCLSIYFTKSKVRDSKKNFRDP